MNTKKLREILASEKLAFPSDRLEIARRFQDEMVTLLDGSHSGVDIVYVAGDVTWSAAISEIGSVSRGITDKEFSVTMVGKYLKSRSYFSPEALKDAKVRLTKWVNRLLLRFRSDYPGIDFRIEIP